MPKFNFNYCKSIFILCLWIKILLFNYNIQNNLTIIIINKQMKWRWKVTYIEAGEFGCGTWTVKLSELLDYWILGLLDSRTVKLSELLDYWIVGLLDCRTIGLSDC